MTRRAPPLGARVYVAAYKRPFVVRARNERFAICTRPFLKTVIYFVLDTERGVRGTENLVFGMGAETDERCEEMLARLANGETEVSYRNVVPWDGSYYCDFCFGWHLTSKPKLGKAA